MTKVCINGTGHMTKMSDGHHMMVCEYWRSRSFLDLGPRSFTYEN